MKTMLIFFIFMILGGTPFFSQGLDSSIKDLPVSQESQQLPETSPLPNFEDQIHLWIHELSSQPNFKTWKTAQWTSHPLGPGTHGWVILITNKSEELGYLIVNSTPTGEIILSEYGNGPTPLYSMLRLYQTLLQHELIPAGLSYTAWTQERNWQLNRLYLQPFLALWGVQKSNDLVADTYYFDAKTGDLLSLSEQDILNLSKTSSKSSIKSSTKRSTKRSSDSLSKPSTLIRPSHIISTLSLPSFDPYEQINWIDHPPLKIKDFNDLKTALKTQKKLTFTARPVDETQSTSSILIPFAVIGYHGWDHSERYIAVDPIGLQEGIRYIPFSAFVNSGSYYAQ